MSRRMSTGAFTASVLGGAAAFSPLSLNPVFGLLAQPAYLFDDEDHLTNIVSGGQGVGAVTNLGSDGDFWTQPTDVARPAYNTSGGFHWMDFNGADDNITGSWLDYALSSVQTIYMACRVSALADNLDTWVSNDADNANIRLNDVGVPDWRGNGASAGAADFAVSGLFFVNGADTEVYVAGQDQIVQAVAAAPRSTGVIGRAGDGTGGTSRIATGRLYSLWGFAGTHTAGEAAQMRAYLATLCPDLA